MALDGKFDRAYIRERAVRLYDMAAVGPQFECAFKSILDIFNGANGWYSPVSHFAAVDQASVVVADEASVAVADQASVAVADQASIAAEAAAVAVADQASVAAEAAAVAEVAESK